MLPEHRQTVTELDHHNWKHLGGNINLCQSDILEIGIKLYIYISVVTTWTPGWTPRSWRCPRRWSPSTWRWRRPTSWTSGGWWTSASWGRPWGLAGSYPAGQSSPTRPCTTTGRCSGTSARPHPSSSPDSRRSLSDRKSREGTGGERWKMFFRCTQIRDVQFKNIFQFEFQSKNKTFLPRKTILFSLSGKKHVFFLSKTVCPFLSWLSSVWSQISVNMKVYTFDMVSVSTVKSTSAREVTTLLLSVSNKNVPSYWLSIQVSGLNHFFIILN